MRCNGAFRDLNVVKVLPTERRREQSSPFWGRPKCAEASRVVGVQEPRHVCSDVYWGFILVHISMHYTIDTNRQIDTHTYIDTYNYIYYICVYVFYI